MSEININGFNCRYELSGNLESRETIVFINGIASLLESWQFIKEKFADDYKLLCYDLRGQWFSEVTNDKQYSFSLMAEDLNSLLGALNINNSHIISTSLGGEIAQWFAIKYPRKAKSLVVVTSVSETNKLHISQVKRWKASAERAIEMIDASGGDKDVIKKAGYEYYQTILPEIHSNTFLENNEDVIEERINNFTNLCHRDFFQGHIYLCDMFFGMYDNEKTTTRLADIKCPTLVVAGEVDIVKPVVFSEILANGIPDSKLIVLKDVGHAAFHEKPNEMVLLIKEFLKSETGKGLNIPKELDIVKNLVLG